MNMNMNMRGSLKMASRKDSTGSGSVDSEIQRKDSGVPTDAPVRRSSISMLTSSFAIPSAKTGAVGMERKSSIKEKRR